MTDQLVAAIAGEEIGRVHRNARGRLSFVYKDDWRKSQDAFPLSLSMPLGAAKHGPAAVEAFLWGLLPDNELVLQRWASRFQVSARNVFALIANVGEDCAGAVQFVSPERLEAVNDGKADKVDWLDEHAVAERLRILREDHAAWRLPRDTGQFSLAGAQPKTALLSEKNKWGIPSGRIPTTHILKPPTGLFDGHAENEHVCLALARSLGMPAARSAVARFENEIAIVIERYDRQRQRRKIVRIHQEDACQALGILPTRKYQTEQGPGPLDIVELLRTHSSEREADVETFISALGFNWLIGGTDAHARNYSLLIGEGPRIRLAPLYDVASTLPYDEFDPRKLKLAMKIGDTYRLNDIGLRQWQKFARAARLDEEKLIAELRRMALALPDAISDEKKRANAAGLKHGLIDRLTERLTARTRACVVILE